MNSVPLEIKGRMVLSALIARDKISLIEYSWLVKNHSHILEDLAAHYNQPLDAMQVIIPLLKK